MVGTASRVRFLAADTEHGLQPVIDEPYPLEVIAAALKQGHGITKIALAIPT